MIDKEKGMFFVRIIIGIIALILLFTVIIPKWEQFDNGFNDYIRRFVRLFFDTGSSFKKSGTQQENEVLTEDFQQSRRNFLKQFLSIKTPEDIDRIINLGNTLLKMESPKIEIIRDTAFLYYISKDFDKAAEYYQKILNEYPKGKRVFKSLKDADSRSVKRALLELAAVYYEQGNTEQMLDYYKQYLRATQRDDVYRDLLSQGIDEAGARLGIFSNIGDDGFLSYKKAIEQLEAFSRDYPDNQDVFYKLGVLNYDMVNLFGQDDFPSIQENYYNAGIYFYKVLDKSDDFRKRTINKDLENLEKIKAKYEKTKAEP